MNIKTLFEQFNTQKILVIGDVMIDAYVMGKVNRVSPEAPVPIVSLTKREERLGGAANVALNLVALGAKPIMCSVVGDDKDGQKLIQLLEDASISCDGLIHSKNRQTTVKTRVIGNNQHLLRVDSEDTSSIQSDEESALIVKIKELIEALDISAIIFEDYNKGVLTPKVISEIIDFANLQGVVSTVDPKKDNFFAYKEATLFKPNLKELKEGVNSAFDMATQRAEFKAAVHQMEEELKNKISFVTLSEHGVFIKNQHEEYFIDAHLRNIADVSGAGDTVISVATLCLAAGASIDVIAAVANIAGGLVCEKSGVVPIDKDQLLTESLKLIAQ